MCGGDNSPVVPQHPDSDIAPETKQTPNAFRSLNVIDVQLRTPVVTREFAADVAPPLTDAYHLVVLFERDPVLSQES